MSVIYVEEIYDIDRSKKNLVPKYRTSLDIYSRIIINYINNLVYYFPDSESILFHRPDTSKPTTKVRMGKEAIIYETLCGKIKGPRGRVTHDFVRISIDSGKIKPINVGSYDLVVKASVTYPIFPFMDVFPLAGEVRINVPGRGRCGIFGRGEFQDYIWFKKEVELYRRFYGSFYNVYDRASKRYLHIEKTVNY